MAEHDRPGTLPGPLQGLLQPDAYPHRVDGVRLVQTHISWVLLTGDYAYKLKRPVRYDFIDLRDPQRRAALCEEELRLNRRFAPSLYLEVCDVRRRIGRAYMGGEGEILERAVRMRQFPQGAELDALLRDDRLDVTQLEVFARELADIHARLPAADVSGPYGEPERIAGLLRQNFSETLRSLQQTPLAVACAALSEPMEQAVQRSLPWLRQRKAGGFVRECHGDLHLRNVARVDGRLQAFDCLEFEPAFRWIDVAEDVACMAMDLLAHARADLAAAFVHAWLLASGDFAAARLLSVYGAHRALVRAKVLALETADGNASVQADAQASGQRADAQRYLQVAGRLLGAAKPLLVLMHGVSGSGKSWLAARLAGRHRLLHLRSDVERKRLAGLSPQARSHSPLHGGLYAPDAQARVREHLLAAAESALGGGLGLIVDATLLGAAERGPFIELSRRLGLRCLIVACRAPVQTLRARLAHREQARDDPSEAGPAVLAEQLSRVEPCTEAEGATLVEVDTGDPGSVERASTAVNAYGAGLAGMY